MSKGRPHALITGASAGIGLAFAERLATDGYDLIVVARRRDRLETLAKRLRGEGGANIEVLVADLTKPADLDRVIERLERQPAVDLLINNAGFAGYMPFVQLPPQRAEELIGVHVTAATRLARAAVPGMLARKNGAIVNIGSLLAFSGSLPANPLPARAVYSGAKAYLVAFSEALNSELAGSGVRVQVCCPGVVATEFHEVAGIDRTKFRMVPMAAGDVVSASLAALLSGEPICVPGLQDPAAVGAFQEASRQLLQQGNRPELAERYTGVSSAS